MQFITVRTLFVVFLLVSGSVIAQPATDAPAAQLITQWNAELEQANKLLADPNIEDEALKQLRENLNDLHNRAIAARDQLDAQLNPLNAELAALGPPPNPGTSPESANIAAKRKTLSNEVALKDGQVKELGLILSNADDTLAQISTLRIRRFTQKTFIRGFSALSPEVWQRGIHDFQAKVNAVEQQFQTWFASESVESLRSKFLHLLLTILATLAITWPFSRWFSGHFGRTSNLQTPSYLELLRAALAVGFLRSLLPISLILAMFLVLQHDMQWTDDIYAFAVSTIKAFAMIVLTSAVSRAILAPQNGRWRLMPLNDADARYVHKVIVGLAWAFAVDLLMDDWFALSNASLELTILRKFVAGLLIAGLLLALLARRQLWRMDIQHRRKMSDKSTMWRCLRALIGMLVLMIPVSAIGGFVALSRLLGTQIVLTGGLYILMQVAIALFSELIEELLNKDTDTGLKFRQSLELTDEGSNLLKFWLKAAIHSAIYICAILALLIIWGAGGEDLNLWLYKAVFGFSIGGMTISFATLFLAIVFFSVALLLTRLCQRFLEKVVLPQTRIDIGIQHSVRAAIGYIGFILAAGLGISTLGIDLSKLAIIAGALSVGIGFGLQNVVNNFVSGLILLIERPLKVGDWVVVNDNQGYVKNINVRATEIQTFDRASVFIPNSNLIANPLMNWTHADKTGRIHIPVGVAYGSDTRKVQRVLLEVARDHAAVLRSLPPSVLFKGFGDSCLNFELRAFVPDVDKVATITSDLCFAIDEAFREHAIEIPYPQQDVHWQDMDKLESLLEKIISAKNGMVNADPKGNINLKSAE